MTQITAVPVVMIAWLITIQMLSFGLEIPIKEAMVYGVGIYGIMMFLAVGKWYIDRNTDQPESQPAQS